MYKTFSKKALLFVLSFSVATNIFPSQSGQYLDRRGNGGLRDNKCNLLKPVVAVLVLIVGLVVIPEVHQKMTEINENSIKDNYGFRCTTDVDCCAMVCERDNKNPDYYCEKKHKFTSAGRSGLECWHCNSWKGSSCKVGSSDLSQAVTVDKILSYEEKEQIREERRQNCSIQ